MEEVLAHHTNQTAAQVREDIDRDKFLSAHAAKEYGLVDDVLTSRKLPS